jgi:hypothetical protein
MLLDLLDMALMLDRFPNASITAGIHQCNKYIRATGSVECTC